MGKLGPSGKSSQKRWRRSKNKSGRRRSYEKRRYAEIMRETAETLVVRQATPEEWERLGKRGGPS